MGKENGVMPHATHGSGSVADSEEWEFVNEEHVAELLRILRRMLELTHLVFGPEGSDPGDIETCFGETPK